MIITCKSQCWFHIKSIKVHVLETTTRAMKDLFWHTGYIWNEPRRYYLHKSSSIPPLKCYNQAHKHKCKIHRFDSCTVHQKDKFPHTLRTRPLLKYYRYNHISGVVHIYVINIDSVKFWTSGSGRGRLVRFQTAINEHITLMNSNDAILIIIIIILYFCILFLLHPIIH